MSNVMKIASMLLFEKDFEMLLNETLQIFSIISSFIITNLDRRDFIGLSTKAHKHVDI